MRLFGAILLVAVAETTLANDIEKESNNWSSLPDYITTRLKELYGKKTIKSIVHETGYVRPKMIQLFATGEAQVPIESAILLARALQSPMLTFFRMVFAQYGEQMTKRADAICRRLDDEMQETLLYEIRRAAAKDPSTEGAAKKLTFDGPTMELKFSVPLELHRRFTVEAGMHNLSNNELLMLMFQRYLTYRERSA